MWMSLTLCVFSYTLRVFLETKLFKFGLSSTKILAFKIPVNAFFL